MLPQILAEEEVGEPVKKKKNKKKGKQEHDDEGEGKTLLID